MQLKRQCEEAAKAVENARLNRNNIMEHLNEVENDEEELMYVHLSSFNFNVQNTSGSGSVGSIEHNFAPQKEIRIYTPRKG